MSEIDKTVKSPYYNRVAVAVIRNSEGKVLIVKRKHEVESIDGGKLSWTFPGDRITDGVEPSAGAVRHALEQTGYSIIVTSKISERTYHPFKNHLTYFECELLGEEKEEPISPNIETHEWVSPEELNSYFTTNIDLGVAAHLGL